MTGADRVNFHFDIDGDNFTSAGEASVKITKRRYRCKNYCDPDQSVDCYSQSLCFHCYGIAFCATQNMGQRSQGR